MNKVEILKRIDECEKARDFSAHTTPPNTKKILPVANNYDYMQKGFFTQLGCICGKTLFNIAKFVIPPYFRFKVVGKENLKGVKKAIITTKHINNMDSILIKRAVGHNKLRITVAPFNNYKSLLGKCMRGAGVMPIGESLPSLRHFSKAVTQYLGKNNYILFYPEGSLWWCYEKPRPLIDGAYFYAVKNNVPIIPMFFTFKNIKKKKNGIYKKQFILHIGKPIHPKDNLSSKENIAYLKEQNLAFNIKTYEDFYGKKLEYLN